MELDVSPYLLSATYHLPDAICGKRLKQVILEAIVIALGDQEYG
jgi:hypothetical protein